MGCPHPVGAVGAARVRLKEPVRDEGRGGRSDAGSRSERDRSIPLTPGPRHPRGGAWPAPEGRSARPGNRVRSPAVPRSGGRGARAGRGRRASRPDPGWSRAATRREHRETDHRARLRDHRSGRLRRTCAGPRHLVQRPPVRRHLLHHARDRTFREDDSKVRTCTLPRAMASRCNLAISVFRRNGLTDIAAPPHRSRPPPAPGHPRSPVTDPDRSRSCDEPAGGAVLRRSIHYSSIENAGYRAGIP